MRGISALKEDFLELLHYTLQCANIFWYKSTLEYIRLTWYRLDIQNWL